MALLSRRIGGIIRPGVSLLIPRMYEDRQIVKVVGLLLFPLLFYYFELIPLVLVYVASLLFFFYLPGDHSCFDEFGRLGQSGRQVVAQGLSRELKNYQESFG